MKKWFLFLALATIVSAPAFAQDKQGVVLTVAGERVTLEEFENIFRKNNRDTVITRQALEEYMEMFINFKLKVRAAKDMGMDTVAKFRNELAGYRAQLARPYMNDDAMLGELVKQAYERKKEEIRASHILIKCDPGAAPADTLNAFNRIRQLRERIMNGEDFGAVALESSEDPSAKSNSGDLGYFTVFQMVYPFEEAAYNTQAGQVSQPIRTRYGYHLVKVVDRRPARGEILVAHIMVKDRKDESGAQVGEQKIQEIYQKLLAGEKFEELASKYSEDGSTSKKGGELPWFGTNKMVMEFEDAAFSLRNNGDFSQPFRTSYGWHIVKRLDYRGIPSFEDTEREIRSKVSKDSRAEVTRASFIQKLKKEYNFSYHPEVLKPIAAKADTTVFSGNLIVKKKDLTKVLLSIHGQNYLVQDFTKALSAKKNTKSKLNPSDFVMAEAAAFAEEQLLKYEDSRLERKHNAFRLLMNEYRDGILLFELTEQKVWSRAVKDTAGLRAFFEANTDKFMWPERLDAVIYTCASADIAKKARVMIAAGTDRSEIASKINEGTQLNIEIQEGVFTREDKDVLAAMEWKKGLSPNITQNGQVFIVYVKEVLAPSPKKFSEAKGMATSEYQNYLEQQWIGELRSTYSFSINKDVLYTIR
ncbi:MAG: peptidylprolyl isomerase [Flavobacteriales bacterium]